MVRFIHCSDLHLDTPFKGLTRRDPEHAARHNRATSESFARIIDLCIEKNADFLVIAGDIYDSANRSVSTQIGFARQLERLEEHGTEVFIAGGSHDPLSDWLSAAKLPSNAHRFGSDRVERVRLEKDGKAVADVYGISCRAENVTENLASLFSLWDDRAPINIAVLHRTAGEAAPRKNYAPFRIEEIETKGFDYWALGHIHKHSIVRDAFPAVVYPGNPQGRGFGETGPKGCVLVEIEAGRPPSIEFIPTQTIRFEEVTVDITGASDLETLSSLPVELPGRVLSHDPRASYVFRVRLEGRTPLDSALRREGEIDKLVDRLNEGCAGRDYFSYIDSIELRTLPDIDLEALRAANDFPSTVLKVSEAISSEPSELRALFEEVESEFRSVAAREEVGTLDSARYREILEEGTTMLLSRLVEDAE